MISTYLVLMCLDDVQDNDIVGKRLLPVAFRRGGGDNILRNIWSYKF